MTPVTDLGYTVQYEDGTYVLAGDRGARYKLIEHTIYPEIYITLNAKTITGNRKLKGGYEKVMSERGVFYAIK